MKRPADSAEIMKQYNVKNFCSIVLFALVNAKYRLIWGTFLVSLKASFTCYIGNTKTKEAVKVMDLPYMVLHKAAIK